MPWPFVKKTVAPSSSPLPSTQTEPSSSSSTSAGTSLPPGDLGRSLVGNTFAFHSNAQALILETTRKHPRAKVVRARVINRDIALVIDHGIATSVLAPDTASSSQHPIRPRDPSPSAPGPSSSSAELDQADVGSSGNQGSSRVRFSHREAYKQLIAAFFSEPNILLEDADEPARPAHRAQWDEHVSLFLSQTWDTEIRPLLKTILTEYRDKWTTASDPGIDLYESMKELSHRLIFAIFLGLEDPEDDEYRAALEMTDTSLRGQFSMPLRFAGVGGWGTSTYSKGLKAQAAFDDLVAFRASTGRCPFLHSSPSSSQPPRQPTPKDGRKIDDDTASSHLSTFSSSLVIKALASYLTFAVLQRSHHSAASISHLLLETERLCPPIVGVLRRLTDGPWTIPDDTTQNLNPHSPTDTDAAPSGIEIPTGWDVWLYFPLINRDPLIYGDDARRSRPARWEDESLPQPLSFGQGAKRCLGLAIVRRMVRTVLEELVGESGKVRVIGGMDGSLEDFLGWRDGSGKEQEWEGVKQLPVQRPRGGVRVRFEGV